MRFDLKALRVGSTNKSMQRPAIKFKPFAFAKAAPFDLAAELWR